ncbi:SMC-Scp complex subunit ScpB [Candidatus Woesearchaeota archaeon]|nr:SMC-Scp complex subunit ScpB [Candidatus Woesearchaeota archaeon]MBT4368765.1 SMC-Scp complex subunit ScpB [Candidatus Woesearchaeota archaeon]MBT4712054.1 SMC-Scp complex subunit ScpB [Candidatus Woesearchaeota archaeon]MBT6639198.1 SMC-Scp complex subunit ScpB [Candidatus Woesearchaeota archaeon]MBT7134398.1 SMC-Scp complex subunit ScpB [Candidatus Woesearchaeota archaeon]
MEALLFAYGKLVSEDELKTLLNKRNIKPLLDKLKEKYSTTDTSLNLIQQDNKWKLTVKDDYLSLVKGIVTKTELDRQTMETLAVIAFKYPVLQSEVINIRNASAYEHIKTLTELGYLMKEKFGRSFKLKLTPKFFDYFDLPEDKLKTFFSDFKGIEKEIVDKESEADNLRKKIEEQNRIMKVKKENKQLPDPDSTPSPDPLPVPEPTPEPIPEPTPEPTPDPEPSPEIEQDSEDSNV